MAGTGPIDLQDLASELLAAAVEALDTVPDYNPDLDAAPDRQYVSPADPAIDCEQVTVQVQPVLEAPTNPLLLGAGTRHRQDFRLNLVGFTVWVTRCVPNMNGMGGAPSTTDLQASSAQLNADAWALWNHIWNMARAGLIFSLCEELYMDGLQPVNPQGGFGGWKLNLRAQLQGYEETL